MNRTIANVLFCTVATLIFTLPSFGGKVTITVGDDFFSPSIVTLTNGDTVVWTNTGFASHTTTSGTSCTANGFWNSPLFGHNGSYTITNFNFGAGTYPYFCVPHCSFGMTGQLTVVAAANAAPTVTITNPVSSASFPAPATFPIQASATDSDGAVTNVQFLINGSSVGNATSAPYTVSANNLNTGSYTLTAVASDNGGAKATNSITITVTNTPPTVAITNPAANSVFQAPAIVTIGASASDVNGTVTNVDFFVNGALIGNSTLAPFRATANGLANGSYQLTAVASDNSGAKQTNQISVSVTTITLSAPGFGAGQFQFTATGVTAGKTNIVQGSALLNFDWISLATNVATANSAIFTGLDATNFGFRFFRLIQLP